jgi:hypothetical protein
MCSVQHAAGLLCQCPDPPPASPFPPQVKGPKKELSRKEKKALEKLRKARRERGEEVTDSEEDE